MVWTVTEIADKTGLTKRHISRLVKTGVIKGERKPAGWLVSDDEAERFFKSREEKATDKESAS